MSRCIDLQQDNHGEFVSQMLRHWALDVLAKRVVPLHCAWQHAVVHAFHRGSCKARCRMMACGTLLLLQIYQCRCCLSLTSNLETTVPMQQTTEVVSEEHFHVGNMLHYSRDQDPPNNR